MPATRAGRTGSRDFSRQQGRSRLLLAGIAAALLLSVAGRFVMADRVVARARRFKACVLLVPPPDDPAAIGVSQIPGGNAQEAPTNPWIFYVLNNRTDIKPDGWSFYNPAAVGAVTQAQVARWDTIGGGPGKSGLTPGQRLRPNVAPYWEVPLTAANYRSLAQMDVVYLPVPPIQNGGLAFTEEQRKTLMRLVDSGVLLWVDWGSPASGPASGSLGGQNLANPFFLPLDFSSAAAQSNNPPAPHPLLNGLFRVDATRLGRAGLAESLNLLPGGAYVGTPLTQVVPGPGLGRPAVAAGRYGNGFVVASSGDIGGEVSKTIPPVVAAPNQPDLGAATVMDMEFAYNVAFWRGESNHPQKGPRHQTSEAESAQGYFQRWGAQVQGAQPFAAPLLVNDMVIGATQGAVQVYAPEPLAVSPLAPTVPIATWAAPGSIAGMAYGDPVGQPPGQGFLFVAANSGVGGAAFVVSPPGAGGNLPTLGTTSAPLSKPAWSAPAYSAGVLSAEANSGAIGPSVFLSGGISGGQGMVAGYRLAGTNLVADWHFPLQPNAPIGPMVASPVPAVLADPATGAVDRMVFVTHLATSAGGQQATGALNALVVSTASEPLVLSRTVAVNGEFQMHPLRDLRTQRGDNSKPFELRIINPNGYTVTRIGGVMQPNGANGVRFAPQVGQAGPFQVFVQQNALINAIPGGDLNQAMIAGDTVVLDYYVTEQNQDNTQPGTYLSSRYDLLAFPQQVGGVPVVTGIPGGIAVGADDLVYCGTGRGYLFAAGYQSVAKPSVPQASIAPLLPAPRVRWKAHIIDPPTNFDGTGTDPNPANGLATHAFTNSPAVSSDVAAFASREGRVYVFKTDALISFHLPFPNPGHPSELAANEASQIQLRGTDESGQPQPISPLEYSVDIATQTVTFRDMRSFTLDLAQAVAPPVNSGLPPGLYVKIEVDYRGVAQAPDSYVQVPLIYWFDASNVERAVGGFIGGPVISGDRIYVPGGSGLLYDLPAVPQQLDPSFPLNPQAGLQSYNLNQQPWQGENLFRTQQIAPHLFTSPAVSNGALALATPQGVSLYKPGVVVVADNNRVVEADGDAHQLASTDSTTTLHVQDTAVALPTDPPPGGQVQDSQGNFHAVVPKRTFLNHPAVARRLARGASLVAAFASTGPIQAPDSIGGTSEQSELARQSTLVADTGNSRVVEFNPAGKAIGEWTEIQDPFKILPSGEPRTLSQPTDVQRWVDLEVDSGPNGGPNAPKLIVFHTLIADSGNTRVLEVVDKVRWQGGRFSDASFPSDLQAGAGAQADLAGNPIWWYHVLVWSSQTNGQGLKLKYRTAQRLFWPNGGAQDPGFQANRPSSVPPFLPLDAAFTTTACTVGQQVTAPDFQKNLPPQARPGGDSIVFLMGRRAAPGSDVPFRAAGQALQDQFSYRQGNIDPSMPIISNLKDANGNLVHALSGVTSLQRILDPQSGTQNFLLADAGGVFLFQLNNVAAQVVWAFTKTDYETPFGNLPPLGLGRSFTPSSARLLPNGLVLVASRSATPAKAPFSVQPGANGGLPGGDIFMLNPAFYNPANNPVWPPASITWRAPAPRFRDPANPARPDPNLAANAANPLELPQTYTPEQPSYADLLFLP